MNSASRFRARAQAAREAALEASAPVVLSIAVGPRKVPTARSRRRMGRWIGLVDSSSSMMLEYWSACRYGTPLAPGTVDSTEDARLRVNPGPSVRPLG